MFKAIIYDMDGLLIDSMLHWSDFWKVYWGKKGLEITREMGIHMTGRSGKENVRWMRETYLPDLDEEDYMKVRNNWMPGMYREKTKLMPGAEKLVKYGKLKGFKQAIASGASLDVIKIVVDKFIFYDHIDEIISADQVGYIGKPDPIIFLHTAEKLGIKPENCVVFEDAENGVIAAKKAGMKCVAVLDPRWSFGDFSQADLVVNSLEDERIVKFLDL